MLVLVLPLSRRGIFLESDCIENMFYRNRFSEISTFLDLFGVILGGFAEILMDGT